MIHLCLQILEQPYTRGFGKKGMIGVNQTQHIMKNILKNNTRHEDPREAILKYANVAEGIAKRIPYLTYYY